MELEEGEFRDQRMLITGRYIDLVPCCPVPIVPNSSHFFHGDVIVDEVMDVRGNVITLRLAFENRCGFDIEFLHGDDFSNFINYVWLWDNRNLIEDVFLAEQTRNSFIVHVILSNATVEDVNRCITRVFYFTYERESDRFVFQVQTWKASYVHGRYNRHRFTLLANDRITNKPVLISSVGKFCYNFIDVRIFNVLT